MSSDKMFRVLLLLAALFIPTIAGGIIYSLMSDSYDAIHQFGFFQFLFSSEWNYTDGNEAYGALPFIRAHFSPPFSHSFSAFRTLCPLRCLWANTTKAQR